MSTVSPPPTTARPSDLTRQLADYRLTTAKILYHLPDHPSLLQEYIWQQLDIAPRFPELQRFLHFWERELEGRLHSVSVATVGLISAGGFRAVDHVVIH
ncbi:Usg family protein [Rhodospirillum rubrum]|uniref:usg protein n=1 Tax=Rhodospirillum rubrum TaxID=1085 RepID=UPI0019049A93|nr:usg protein [Rhodospirillum rubrum]MBK1665488.1 Usg family protein [Rhodospirillum rubrum]MBK1678106.1 Usg family protein [Rhodospirillum rubrum]